MSAVRTVRVAIAAAALLPGLVVPWQAAAVGEVICSAIVPSPDFAKDRTAFCTYRTDSQSITRLAVTTDGGRRWVPAAAAGMARDDLAGGLGISLSPRYRMDRTLFAITTTGTYASTDHGATFTLVSALATGGRQRNPVPYLADPLAGTPLAGERLYLAYSSQRLPARIDVEARLHLPAPGAPLTGMVGFAVPTPTSAPLAFGHQPAGSSDQVAVAYTCTALLMCTMAFTFPAGLYFGLPNDFFVGIGSDPKTVVVRLNRASDDSVHLWRSTDGGRTFAEWASVERLLDPVNRTSGAPPMVTFTVDPARPRTAYLRVSGFALRGTQWHPAAPPGEQVFRSSDAGTTWRRVAYGLGYGQTGRRGSLPWDGPVWGAEGASIVAASGGVLFALGSAYPTPGTVFCSRDGGVRWRAFC